MSLPPNVFGGLLNPLSGGGTITPPVAEDMITEGGTTMVTEGGTTMVTETPI